MNDFQDRPKAGLHNVITPEQWRESHPSTEAIDRAKAIRAKQDQERAELLQHFIDDQRKRDKRRAWLLAPVRVMRDIVRFLKGAP